MFIHLKTGTQVAHFIREVEQFNSSDTSAVWHDKKLAEDTQDGARNADSTSNDIVAHTLAIQFITPRKNNCHW